MPMVPPYSTVYFILSQGTNSLKCKIHNHNVLVLENLKTDLV